MTLKRVVFVLPWLLAACAMPQQRMQDFNPRAAPERCKVTVHVSETNEIVVDHEPPHTKGCTGKAIRWHLNGGGWTFRAVDPIVFTDNQTVLPRSCTSVDDNDNPSPKHVRCAFTGRPTGVRHKYTIHIVRKHSAGEDAELLDPHVFND